MAPRRGSGGGGVSFASSSAWSVETSFSMDMYESKSLFIAGFAFDVLLALTLILFLTWACLIRNHNGQKKGLIMAIIAWLCFMITAIVYEIFFLAEAVVTQYYNIDLMLQVFFSDLSVLLIVYVFYNLIHRVINRLTDSGKPYAAISIVHWVILSILAAISIAAWAMYVAFRVYYVQGSTRDIFELADNMNKVDSARVILFWVVSLEIFAWVLFATVKAGSHRFTSRSPLYGLIGGSICWFALCLMNTVIYIKYYLEANDFVPAYLQTATSILQFIFGVGTLIGILFCCQNWHHIDNSMDKPPMTMQYPYETQYQQYPQYNQQFQTYHGQPQPQYPQQYQQQAQPFELQPSPQPQK